MGKKTVGEPAMTSAQINEAIAALEDPDTYEDPFEVRGLEGTGKLVPCIGWYWRELDFDDDFAMGKIEKIKYPGMGFNPLQTMMEAAEPPGFVGFMENNKWGYRMQVVGKGTPEWNGIRDKLILALVSNTQETFQDLFDFIQGTWLECDQDMQEANHGGLDKYNSCERCGWDSHTDFLDNPDPERFVGMVG